MSAIEAGCQTSSIKRTHGHDTVQRPTSGCPWLRQARRQGDASDIGIARRAESFSLRTLMRSRSPFAASLADRAIVEENDAVEISELVAVATANRLLD
jgi:hypothetical protein